VCGRWPVKTGAVFAAYLGFVVLGLTCCVLLGLLHR
jgi:hypothetical protein